MRTKKNKGRTDLVGEHKVGDAGQALFAIIFLIVYVLDSFLFGFSTSLNQIVPIIIRVPAGIVILLAAGYLSMTGLNIVFNEVRNKPEVLKKSVFSIVRHPIYLGEILLYIGFLFISMSIASAGVFLFAAIFLYYISRYEEKILLEFFGEEYREYMKEVPMLIPKISFFLRNIKRV